MNVAHFKTERAKRWKIQMRDRARELLKVMLSIRESEEHEAELKQILEGVHSDSFIRDLAMLIHYLNNRIDETTINRKVAQ